MSSLTVPGTVGLTMSSREIAELTNKRHPDVRRDIRNMLEALGKGVSSFAHTYRDSQNKEQEEYCLDRELTLTLVSGYDIPLRHRVVTRLAELESAPQNLNPANFSRLQLIELAMQAEQERLVLSNQVEELQPKAEALDRIATADGSMCITNAAKNLQMRPKDLFAWLQEHHWIYRRAGGSCWLAYQPRIQQGLLDHKVTTVSRSDGSEKVVEQVLVTAKGLTKLAAEARQ